MYRRLVIALQLLATSLSAHAADPNEMMQNSVGVIQQSQQLEKQRKQQKELERQQRKASIDQMVTACKNYDEVACYHIIETYGVPPFAMYTAFFNLGDIELQRGEREKAQSSYRYALQWASRMQDGGQAQRAAAAKLTALSKSQLKEP
jgi:hypothetical protein